METLKVEKSTVHFETIDGVLKGSFYQKENWLFDFSTDVSEIVKWDYAILSNVMENEEHITGFFFSPFLTYQVRFDLVDHFKRITSEFFPGSKKAFRTINEFIIEESKKTGNRLLVVNKKNFYSIEKEKILGETNRTKFSAETSVLKKQVETILAIKGVGSRVSYITYGAEIKPKDTHRKPFFVL